MPKITRKEADPKKKPEEQGVTFEINVLATKEVTYTKQELLDRKSKLQTRKLKINEQLMGIVNELENINDMLGMLENPQA